MKALRLNRLTVPLVMAMVLAVVLPLMVGNKANAAPGFVTTSGTKFMLDGKPFYVAGTNSHYLGWGTRAEVDSVLGYADASNYNVVRGILHSVTGSLDGTTKPHIWNPASTGDASNMGMHGTYLIYWDTATNTYAFNPSTTNGLGRWDYVIAKAGQLGLKLNIAMMDFWQWAGGTQQINSWYIPGYNGSSHAQRYTFFYSDSRTKQLYKDWVSFVLNRTNSITGVKYKDDPTIFAWDLMNEPEVSSVSLAQGWYQEMASYIKAQGAQQLVTTGSEGFYGGQAGSDPTTEAANVPAIDFQTWHTYPTYHNISPAQVNNLINQHCATAAASGKPVLMQEFAYPARSAAEKVTRSGIYSGWADTIYNNNDCAGWLSWRVEGKVVPPATKPHPQDDNVDPATFIWPPDNGEGFSIYGEPDTSKSQYDPAYQMFATQAARLIAKNGGVLPSSPPPSPPASPSPSPSASPQPPGTVNVDDSVQGTGQNQWNYSGWNHCTACDETAPAVYYNASQSWSLNSGETATMAFNGTQVVYRAVTGSHHGIAAVSIDGGTEVSVDLYAATKTGDVAVWTSPVLSAGNHTLRIRNTGTKNAGASGTVVTLDRAVVTGGSTTSPSPSAPPASPSPQPSTSPPATGFVKGINLNGPAVVIEGNQWVSQTQAQSTGFTVSGGTAHTNTVTPSPLPDAATVDMLHTGLLGTDLGTITMSQTVANGTYQVYVWEMESVQGNTRRFNVTLEGILKASNLGDLALSHWRENGAYTVTVSDGVLNINVTGAYGKPAIMGLAIYRI
ncbi:cellulase family glycosylhydrolase [Catellatospora chokoriensis]|uniref:mannan endo-1,4-beta-mannosidase n=1 Tax=Catellatospora chokoriensis TaxID=310353 RepID=A0A8J3K004_9ACTN|nr:cellulase family glycosylhydrolase [Catellatospora chokoriensis]GIF89962.1 hypothetical protein Cch02nite_34060 [Catellatospora chokoriensis]